MTKTKQKKRTKRTQPDAETLALLEQWEKQHEQLHACYEADQKLTGATIDSPLWNSVWTVFDAYTRQLEHRLGENPDSAHGTWLGWYQCDNDMGKRGMEAGYDDRVRPIRNIHDLAGLLTEARRR
jgi:hypothetical protein